MKSLGKLLVIWSCAFALASGVASVAFADAGDQASSGPAKAAALKTQVVADPATSQASDAKGAVRTEAKASEAKGKSVSEPATNAEPVVGEAASQVRSAVADNADTQAVQTAKATAKAKSEVEAAASATAKTDAKANGNAKTESKTNANANADANADANANANATAKAKSIKSSKPAKPAKRVDSAEMKACSSNGLAANANYVLRPVTNSYKAFGQASATAKAPALAGLTGAAGQQWKLQDAGDGAYVLVNKATKMVLAAPAAAKARSKVLVQAPGGAANQLWSIAAVDDKSYVLAVQGAKGMLYLASDGTLKSSATAAAQHWEFFDIDAMRARLDAQALKGSESFAKGAYVIQKTGTRRVLDVAYGSTKSGANVLAWTVNMGENQKWKVEFTEKGYARISIAKTGKQLAVATAKVVPNANVVMDAPKPGLAQKWILKRNLNGTVRISSALWEGLSLEVANMTKDGANVRIAGLSTDAKQQWKLRALAPEVAPSDTVKDGWYSLRSALSSKSYLDVRGISDANGTVVELWTPNTTVAQAFQLQRVGQYYRLKAGTGPNVAVEVQRNAVVPDLAVQTRKAQAKASLYSLKRNDNGSYSLISVSTGLVLGASSGKGAAGTKIVAQDEVAGSKAQSFYLEPRAGLLAEGFYAITTKLPGNRTLSVRGNSLKAGALAELQSSYGSLSQKWFFAPVSGRSNVYTVESPWSGKLLTGAGRQAVRLRDVLGKRAQWWQPVYTSAGWNLKNVGSGKFLSTANGASRQGTYATCEKAASAKRLRWSIDETVAIESGVYELLLNAKPALALDVRGAQSTEGAEVNVQARNGKKTSQRWYYNADDGTLTNMNSGFALDVQYGSSANGTKITQWTRNADANQKWQMLYVGGGAFEVFSGVPGEPVLTAKSAKSGGKVVSSAYAGVRRQLWKPNRLKSTAPASYRLITSFISNGHGSLNPSYVVIHETADPGATARNLRDYWSRNSTYAVHYTVDWNGDCYYCVPEHRLCWQVGNGNPYVVGIELCHAMNKGDFEKVWKYGVEWAAWQLDKRGWGVNRLISHRECGERWGGTDHVDPHTYFAEYGKTWEDFVRDVRAAM